MRLLCGEDAIQKEREGGVALLEDPRAAEGAELFGENEFVVMLENDESVRRKKRGRAEKFECAGVVDRSGVRRIEEDVIDERSGGFVARSDHFEAAKSVGGEDGGARSDFEPIEILADQFCRGGVIFDEDGFGGAAAEGFDAYGTGAGKDIDETRVHDSWAQDVEKRFAQAIACGTEGWAFEAFEDAAAIFAGDDAH